MDNKFAFADAARIIRQLSAKHQGETTRYTACSINCGGSSCIFRLRIKNGRVTVIEPDDHYNLGVGVEDRSITIEDLTMDRLQRRSCPVAWAWHKHLYSEGRLLYPLRRVAGTKRGDDKFERISWDEALEAIAEKLKYYRDNYGPYSILTPYFENPSLDGIFGWLGAGVQGWGWCSQDAERLAQHLMSGYPGWEPPAAYDMGDQLLHSKMIVLWGIDPTVTHLGPAHQYAYYIKMAREKGTPVICIDPRYTATAAILADQWIPIKPGTDMAMMLAIAYTLINENMYNSDFVARFVETDGFKLWCDYVLGISDGVPKTPKWAEQICSVPAETIIEFTRLYAKMNPTFLHKNWSVSRKSRGENTARAAACLQAMMGYFGGPGGFNSLSGDRTRVPMSIRRAPPIGLTPRYAAPRMYRSNRWAEAILLIDKVNSGEMSIEEYRRRIGWRANPNLPNPIPKMLMPGSFCPQGSNTLVTGAYSTTEQIKALEKLEFVVMMASTMNPTAKHADIILPVADTTFEDLKFAGIGQYGGFSNLTICPHALEPLGEAKPDSWIYSKLAEKLGFARMYNTYYTNDENWYKDWERYLKKCYDKCQDDLRIDEVKLPAWDDFLKETMVNLDVFYEKPLYGFPRELEQAHPFPTKSGKIEFYSEIIGNENQRGEVHFDSRGRIIDNLPNDWKDLTPLPTYQPMNAGMDDVRVQNYPLLMLTPHDRYRIHSTFWDNPWLKGDVYRHAIWINVRDAKSRGIKDGDQLIVYNDTGKIRIQAYVTSRIMPGVVIVHHGAWFDPDIDGIDKGGCPTVLLSDDKSPVTPPLVTTLIDVKKIE